ncbi:MAG: hypothetical protein AAGH41_05060 [Pseudomonadota bacterium]
MFRLSNVLIVFLSCACASKTPIYSQPLNTKTLTTALGDTEPAPYCSDNSHCIDGESADKKLTTSPLLLTYNLPRTLVTITQVVEGEGRSAEHKVKVTTNIIADPELGFVVRRRKPSVFRSAAPGLLNLTTESGVDQVLRAGLLTSVGYNSSGNIPELDDSVFDRFDNATENLKRARRCQNARDRQDTKDIDRFCLEIAEPDDTSPAEELPESSFFPPDFVRGADNISVRFAHSTPAHDAEPGFFSNIRCRDTPSNARYVGMGNRTSTTEA